MKGKRVLLVLALLVLPAAAPAQTGSCTVTIDPDSVVLPWNATGGSFLVQNDAACFWKLTGVEQQGSWLTPQSYRWSLLEDTGVDYSVTQNTGPERTATIAIDAYGVYTVVQEAQPCGIFRSANALTGSPTDGVYVANTDCGKLVNVNNGTPGWEDTVTSEGSHYQGLLYGPDGLLYALDTTEGDIVRFAPPDQTPMDVHNFAPPARPRLATFNNRGDLIIVDDAVGTGLFWLENTASVGSSLTFAADTDSIPGSTSKGTFVDVITLANGDLLASTSDGGVYRFPFTPANSPPYGTPDDVSSSALVGTSAIARAANGTVFIAAGNTVDTYAFDEAGDLAPLEPVEPSCATFGDAATIADMNVSADDTLYVTTVTPDAITGDNQGELWEIPYYTYTNGTAEFGCRAKSLLATFAPPEGGGTPLAGVAVPFTAREGKPNPTLPPGVTVPDGSQLFNFFDSLYEFRPIDHTGCTIDVTAEEYSPSTVQGLLQSAGYPNGRPITFYGDNGRALGYHYAAQAGADCPGDESVLYEHAINAYYSGLNPQIMVCEDNGGTCRVITFQTYFSGVGFFPDDGRIGGTNPTFSTTFLVDLESGGRDYWGDFCGYQSPLSTVDLWNEGVIPLATDPLVPVFQGGSDMPVKFTVADTSPEVQGSCKNGPYVTENLTAVLSIARIDPVQRTILEVIQHIDITGGGSYDDGTDRIVFDDPNNKNKPFALQIKLSQDGVPLAQGLYQVVVTDDTANTDGVDTYYFPAQTTYFAVK